MFPNHVKAKVLQELEVIYHGLSGGWCIKSIRPVTLVKGSEHEDKFTVQQRTDYTVDLAFGNRAETDIAVDFLVAHRDGYIVQFRRVR